MEFAFLLKNILARLVLPPFSLLMLAIFGLLVIRRRPRLGPAIVWISIAGISLLATPAVSRLLLNSLSVAPSFDAEAGKSAQAIVILGGGLRRNTPEYGDTLSQLTMDRVRYGAKLARQTQLPILVTGGAIFGAPPEAEIMARTLEGEFNLPVRFVEVRSLDTEDNMKYSAVMLKPERIRKVILVTHDYHMLRALAHCKAADLVCVPAPVSLDGRGPTHWLYGWPSARALSKSVIALHEMIGYLVMSFR